MKTIKLIRSLTALSAAGAIGSAFAAVGYETPAEGFMSSKTRVEVRRELEQARADGTAASNQIDGQENIGARGPAGARYSTPTRREVEDSLTDFRRTHPGNRPILPGELYFGS